MDSPSGEPEMGLSCARMPTIQLRLLLTAPLLAAGVTGGCSSVGDTTAWPRSPGTCLPRGNSGAGPVAASVDRHPGRWPAVISREPQFIGSVQRWAADLPGPIAALASQAGTYTEIMKAAVKRVASRFGGDHQPSSRDGSDQSRMPSAGSGHRAGGVYAPCKSGGAGSHLDRRSTASTSAGATNSDRRDPSGIRAVPVRRSGSRVHATPTRQIAPPSRASARGLAQEHPGHQHRQARHQVGGRAQAAGAHAFERVAQGEKAIAVGKTPR